MTKPLLVSNANQRFLRETKEIRVQVAEFLVLVLVAVKVVVLGRLVPSVFVVALMLLWRQSLEKAALRA